MVRKKKKKRYKWWKTIKWLYSLLLLTKFKKKYTITLSTFNWVSIRDMDAYLTLELGCTSIAAIYCNFSQRPIRWAQILCHCYHPIMFKTCYYQWAYVVIQHCQLQYFKVDIITIFLSMFWLLCSSLHSYYYHNIMPEADIKTIYFHLLILKF